MRLAPLARLQAFRAGSLSNVEFGWLVLIGLHLLLLTYYLLSHSRGTPLSHPHCPVGQLRSRVVRPEYVGRRPALGSVKSEISRSPPGGAPARCALKSCEFWVLLPSFASIPKPVFVSDRPVGKSSISGRDFWTSFHF